MVVSLYRSGSFGKIDEVPLILKRSGLRNLLSRGNSLWAQKNLAGLSEPSPVIVVL